MEHRSIPTLVRSRSRRIGPKPALRWVTGDTEIGWTWADTWGHAHDLALSLLDGGLGLHEPVLLWADDAPETLFAEVGIQAAGGFAVRLARSVDPAAVADVAKAVGTANLAAFGVEADRLDAVAKAVPALAVRALPPAPPTPPGTGSPLDPFSDDPRLEERLSRGGPDTPAVAILPPGVPEPARGRVLVQQNLLGIGKAVALELGAGEEDSWWIPGPWSGAFPRTAGVASAWLSGGDVVATSGIDDPLEAVRRARPTIAVLPAALAASLVQRVMEAVEQGQGTQGRLSRWTLAASLRGENPGLLHQGLSMLTRAGGTTGAEELLGGRLTRLVADSGGPDPESVRRLALLGVAAWATVGNDATAGVITLDRLPAGAPGSRLVPGTTAYREEDGEILVEGVSVSRQLQLRGRDDIPAFIPFCRSGYRGSVVDDRVTWSP